MQSSTGYDWSGKRVVIIGLARSGLAAASLLLHLGARPVLFDEKPLQQLSKDIARLVAEGCELWKDKSIEQLLEKAQVLLISPGVAIDAPIVKLADAHGVLVTGELELGSQYISGPMYAVTGTNGKTTTVSLLENIFLQAGYKTQACGNIGYPITCAAMTNKADIPLPVEVSSFQLETVSSFHPYLAAVLNITPDHLNRHGSMDVYVNLKREIFSQQNSQDFAVLNFDDPIVRSMAKELKSRVVWFSRLSILDEGAYMDDQFVVLNLNGKKQVICHENDIKIYGAHNLENALAATLMAGIAKISSADIAYALIHFMGVEHRIEHVRYLDNIQFFNDSKGTNSASTIKAIEAMDKKTVLLAGGYDKNESFTPLARAVISHPNIIQVVVYGQTAQKIKAALTAEGYQEISESGDMFSAVSMAHIRLLNIGGSVLLSPACASFDQFRDYEQRGREFKKYVNAMHSLQGGPVDA